jgi:hypothetical protein
MAKTFMLFVAWNDELNNVFLQFYIHSKLISISTSCATAQAAGHWFLSKGTQVQSWLTSNKIRGGQRITGAGFPLSSSVFPR